MSSVVPETATKALREVFGFDELRPGQSEVIADVMAGRPVVAVMPTGAGKSLCYQLPAVVLGQHQQVTLVVSPLIALMKDQVDGLRQLGVAAEQLTSACAADEQWQILDRLRSGKVDILYIAPERFRSGRFMAALAEVKERIGLLAIDEAHCISEWGHDFRPDYRRLGQAIKDLAPPRLVALTATATPEVRADILEQLGIGDASLYVRGFARPSLRFAVRHTGGMKAKCKELNRLVEACDGTSLIYAATRKNAEAYTAHLGEQGIKVRVYHAGLEGQERHRAQDEFMEGDVDAIVATNAFGMGVDKADIRLVVHADVPKTPEAYYQEAGRGGRDGEGADCVLLFNHADVKLQEFLIDASNPAPELLRAVWKTIRNTPYVASDPDDLRRALQVDGFGNLSRAAVDSAMRILMRTGYLEEGPDGVHAGKPAPGVFPALDPEALVRRGHAEHDKLRCMVDYAYGMGCRQAYILGYFGDEEAQEGWSCGACDVCTGQADIEEASGELRTAAMNMLEIVSELSGRLGRGRLVGVARGSEDDERYLDCPGYGSLRDHSTDDLKDLVKALEAAGYLERSRGEYPTIAITSRGKRVASGIDELEGFGIRRSSRKRKKASPLESAGPADSDVQARLKALRKRLADEQGVPAYRIFSNKTLDAISRILPSDLTALAEVPGIGPARLDAFGAEILREIAG